MPADQGAWAFQRTINRYEDYALGQDGKVDVNNEDILYVLDKETRVFRGGSFSYNAMYVRSAHRDHNVPSDRLAYVGVRAARTITAE